MVLCAVASYLPAGTPVPLPPQNNPGGGPGRWELSRARFFSRFFFSRHGLFRRALRLEERHPFPCCVKTLGAAILEWLADGCQRQAEFQVVPVEFVDGADGVLLVSLLEGEVNPFRLLRRVERHHHVRANA